MSDLMALVLAGGGGEQLSVLTAERAVSAVPFGGKYRVIDFILSNCLHSKIERVGVLTQHSPASLHDHIGRGRPWDLDRRSGGVMILQPYVTRRQAAWYRGTAHALAMNWDVIAEHTPARVLVLSGDQVYRMDYRALERTHAHHRSALTLAVTRVPADQTHRFGMVSIDHEGRVLGIVEKPDSAQTPFASMGVYLFEYETLGEVLRGTPVALATDVVQPMIAAGVPVFAHEFSGYFEDVGTVRTYYQAAMELVAPEPRLMLHDVRWPLLTRDVSRAPVLMLDEAVVEDSLVANGCRISGTVRRSVLSPGTYVEAGAVITDSIIMGGSTIGRASRVDRAILDKFVRVGEGAVIGHGEAPDGEDCAWLDGLTLIGKGAKVPAGAKLGRSCVVGLGAGDESLGEELASGSRIPNRPWFEDMQ